MTIASAITLPVVAPGVASFAFVIVASTMLFALIDVRPILSPVTAADAIRLDVIAVRPILLPVIDALTILFALIDVRPILSPVIAPVASLTPVTEPSDGTIDEAPNPRNTTWILEEPVGGASENVRVVPLKLYDSICWRIPPTNIISELVATGASRKVKLTVLLSPLKVSIAKVADVGAFPIKANLFSSYVFYLFKLGVKIMMYVL